MTGTRAFWGPHSERLKISGTQRAVASNAIALSKGERLALLFEMKGYLLKKVALSPYSDSSHLCPMPLY